MDYCFPDGRGRAVCERNPLGSHYQLGLSVPEVASKIATPIMKFGLIMSVNHDSDGRFEYDSVCAPRNDIGSAARGCMLDIDFGDIILLNKMILVIQW